MIKLTSIKLTNFGRHEKIDDTFDGYVVGLAGPNGKGKSTVLQALQFALTGNIEHPDPLNKFIRKSSGESPPKFAEVEVTFIANGRKGTIIRRVTPTSTSRKLYWDGEKRAITADKQVSQIFQDILGVDKRAINSTVFIKQGEMDSMFGSDVERRDFYTRLLMLGHLEKVAGIAENHRSHLAGSVQDLGVAVDSANATHRESQVFFEQADRELKALEDVGEKLKTWRAISGLFEDRDENAENVTKYSEALSLMIPETDEGYLVPDKWIDAANATLEELNEKINGLEVIRAKESRLTKAKADLATLSRDTKETLEAYKNHDEAKAALEKLDELGDDPANCIREGAERLRKLDRKDDVAKELPAAQAATSEPQAKAPALDAAIATAQEEYDSNRRVFAVLDNTMRMKTDMLRALRDHKTDDTHECPLCGSDKKADEAQLARGVAEANEALNEIREAGAISADNLRKAKAGGEANGRLLRERTSKMEELTAEAQKLHLETLAYTRESVANELVRLKEIQKAYSAKEFEKNRLSGEYVRYKREVSGKERPATSFVSDLEVKIAEHDKALVGLNWDDAKHGIELSTLKTSAANWQSKLNSVSSAAATLKGAQERTEATEKKITEAIEADAGGAFKLVGEVTSAEVLRNVEVLEGAQADYNTAQGQLAGARKGLVAATDKITELETRAAEQKERLVLAKDLELLRDTFKPNGVSLEYLNYKFGKIARVAGDYLAESGADFMVTASEDVALSYDFLRTDRADEAWMPQNRLSGGQKVRLAVATLRAIHSEIMPDVGIMALDEPTTHLDADAQEAMAEMLRQIGDEGTLQMIVCDHSPLLIDAFSDQINIPA